MSEGIRYDAPTEEGPMNLDLHLNKCGECGAQAVPMKGILSGRKMFWWKCSNKKCNLASQAVTKKKKSNRKWNQLSVMVAELKKRKWTA